MSGPREESTGGGDEYAQHVQGILNRVAELEAQVAEQQRRPAQGRFLSRTPVVGLVALLFGAVVMWNVQSMRSQAEPLPPGARETSLQVSAMVMTSAVHAYREAHGQLPSSLQELGLPPTVTQEIDYIPRGDEFDVVASMGGTQVRYRSEEGPASLLQQMTTGGAPR